MSKKALCATSLVAAIPGGAMMVLMIMAFVNHAGGSSVAIKGISGLLLVIGGSLAAMPAIIMLSGPKVEKPSKKKDVDAPAEDPGATQGASVVEDDAVVDDEASFEVNEEPGDSEAFAETIDQPPEEPGSEDFDLGAEFDDDTDEKPAKR